MVSLLKSCFIFPCLCLRCSKSDVCNRPVTSSACTREGRQIELGSGVRRGGQLSELGVTDPHLTDAIRKSGDGDGRKIQEDENSNLVQVKEKVE